MTDTVDTDDKTRRDFLLLSTMAVGAVGSGLAAWPFIDVMNPAADTLALSTTEVDLAPVEVGQGAHHDTLRTEAAGDGGEIDLGDQHLGQAFGRDQRLEEDGVGR